VVPEPHALSALAELLDLGDHEHVAIVGGGGKTTVLHALGEQLSGSVVLTCTTKMGHDQHRGRPVLLSPSPAEVTVAAAVEPVMVWKRIDGHKAVGVTPAACDEWFGSVDHVVIEADGSRQRPFKAPAEHEPVVPQSATIMVSVIGADALGRVIADQCHRPLRVAALAGCTPYERLSPAAAATVLLHDRGARKELPRGARFAIVITKVDDASAPFVDQLIAELAARSPSTPTIPLHSRNGGVT
jgi:molybdenum cofactor cytidylyltransferase